MTVIEKFNKMIGGNMIGDVSAEKLVDFAEAYAKEMKERKEKKREKTEIDINSTQLRKFYDAIRSIWDDPKVKVLESDKNMDDEFLARLIFLRPHLANAAKKNKMPAEFKEIMDLSIQKIKKKQDLYKFVKFFEAIIAYSK